MLRIKILAVGKIREKYLKEGIQEYAKRLVGSIRLEIIEVEDEPCPDRASTAEQEMIRQKEGEKLLKAISTQEVVILLDLHGKELSSPDLAKLMEEQALSGKSYITFVIGGSLGITDEVRKRSNFRWSFSQLTFPHQLIRLMLIEQIYRACKINMGEPYHK